MRLLSCALAAAALLLPSAAVHADAYNGSPKLAIILVFDQFRGDYLDRYRADFHAKNGWNLFLKQGAHFTDCYYDYANLVTAAGHSTIGTGSYTNGHGIPLNQWWVTGPNGVPHEITSVEDTRYTMVGMPAGQPVSPGASPHNELASTVGDELELATNGKAKVYGVSFKDRAAILTSGHASKGAFWTDHTSGAWITSTYWMQQLPPWAAAFNASKRAAEARREAHADTGEFYDRVGRTPASVSYQLDFAKALIQGEQMGRNPAGVTDMLTLSISSTDILGHGVGPDSPEQRAMIDAADAQLDAFFTWLDSYVGLQNVVVALSGDHGVAPTEQQSARIGMPGAAFSAPKMIAFVEAALEKRFPQVDRHGRSLVLSPELPWLQIQPEPFQAAGVKEEDAEEATAEAVRSFFAEQELAAAGHAVSAERLPESQRVRAVYTASQMRDGRLPNDPYGLRVQNSYSPYVRWAVHMNLGLFQYPGSAAGAGHYSQNAYDRHVPLDLFGAAFVPGTYHDPVAPVDIAATFASLLRLNQPSASVGHVLTQVMRPEAAGSTGPVTGAGH
ncbi:alkaline phosphatase family protein [Terriglobus aquaticus]|uniref:Alkaline phosphatase family protein n=1 Tax=Terriglobus aquaticus TaxID=940139 RepID=A0ABW9KL84_9BACT|nr:alkaline phosphatase family protein [Terriglobus aquaticus]